MRGGASSREVPRALQPCVFLLTHCLWGSVLAALAMHVLARDGVTHSLGTSHGEGEAGVLPTRGFPAAKHSQRF